MFLQNFTCTKCTVYARIFMLCFVLFCFHLFSREFCKSTTTQYFFFFLLLLVLLSSLSRALPLTMSLFSFLLQTQLRVNQLAVLSSKLQNDIHFIAAKQYYTTRLVRARTVSVHINGSDHVYL